MSSKSTRTYSVSIESAAEREFDRLPRVVREEVVGLLGDLSDDPFALGATKMRGMRDSYSLRVGSGIYRLVFSVDERNKRVRIVRIRERGEAYRGLPN